MKNGKLEYFKYKDFKNLKIGILADGNLYRADRVPDFIGVEQILVNRKRRIRGFRKVNFNVGERVNFREEL